MNDTRRQPVPADVRELAPSVDAAWIGDFVLEQRLLGVPGERIGDALVTVETHVQDSGESAEAAFGDATTYARALAGTSRRVPALPGRFVLAMVLGVVGMLLASAGFSGLLGRQDVTVTVGVLVSGVLTLGALAVLLAAPTPVLRVVAARPWVAVVLFLGYVGASSALLLLLPAPLVDLPPVLVAGAGAALLLVSTGLLLVGGDLADPVTGPGARVPDWAGRRWLTALVLPAFTALLLGLDLVVHLLR